MSATVLVLLGVLVGVARADPQADRLADEALSRYHEASYISARELAEEALDIDKGQYVAHYVLGLVMRDSEGNLAQSMYHLGKSRELYETRYASSLDTDWRFHQALLHAAQLVAGEIEAYEFQLQILDYYDARFDPDLTAERAWPLMKLGRMEEARQVARQALLDTDEVQRSLAMNALCAIESEAGDRQAAYEACLAALRAEQANPTPDVTVDAYNAALAAQSALRFSEAEELALQADTGVTVSTANPFAVLAELYVGEGRGIDAVTALRSMQGWRARMPPYLRDQNRAELDATFALVLLGAGEVDLGYDLISRAIDFPDRRAMTTGTGEQARGGHALLRIALRRARDQRAAERAATLGVAGRLGHWLRSFAPDSVAWEDRAAVAAVLSDPDRLERTLRIYLDGGLPVPPWLTGELVDILGPGVVDVALRDVRRAEPLEGLTPYYDAIQAEVAWARGDEAACRELAAKAVAGLPGPEVLLKARTLALAADAAWRSGDRDDALALYEEAYRLDPGVFRRLALPLPATVEVADAIPVTTAAGRMLRRSPRFVRAPGAFTVRVDRRGSAAQVCLLSPSGSRLVCALEPAQPSSDGESEPWTDWDRAAATVDGFHRTAFSMTTGASSLDLRSLSGTTTINAQAAREQMRTLLDDLTAPPSP